MIHQVVERVRTRGRGLTEVTDRVRRAVDDSGVEVGTACVFLHHTSASLTFSENADPDVLRDLETFLGDLAPDGDPRYRHTAEGPDDMSAHVRTMLTRTSVTVPIVGGRCALGTWQGLYLWEHRAQPHERTLSITVTGEHATAS